MDLNEWTFSDDIWILLFNNAIEKSKDNFWINYLREIACIKTHYLHEISKIVLKKKDARYINFLMHWSGSDNQDISFLFKYYMQNNPKNFLSDVLELQKNPKNIRKWEYNSLNHICPKSGYKKPETWCWKNNKKPYNNTYSRIPKWCSSR